MGDVLAREVIEDERVLDRALARVAAVDLAEGEDFPQVNPGVEAPEANSFIKAALPAVRSASSICWRSWKS